MKFRDTYGHVGFHPLEVCRQCGQPVERWGLMSGKSALFDEDAGDLVPHICPPGAVLLSCDGTIGPVSTR